jgi:hypothetical protein
MIPKARDREPLRPKPSVTPNVAQIICMLSAVAFDNEAIFEADKIGDVDAISSIAAACPARDATAPFQRPSVEHATSEREIGQLAK